MVSIELSRGYYLRIIITPMENQVKNCTNCQKDFRIIVQEQQFYQKKNLPLPEHCPECRQKERLLLRNERKLHQRTCDKCKKTIIATYPADSPYVIYCQECFWEMLA